MKTILTAAIFASSLLSTAAFAADAASPLTPVKEIMSSAEKAWTGTGTPPDYVSEDRLNRIYSKDFAAAVRAADKRANPDEVPTVDYDIVTGTQEACPLEDIKYDVPFKSVPPKGTVIPVTVSFKAFTCFKDDPKKDYVTKTIFTVIDEDGVYKIDDIASGDPVNNPYSAKADYKNPG